MTRERFLYSVFALFAVVLVATAVSLLSPEKNGGSRVTVATLPDSAALDLIERGNILELQDGRWCIVTRTRREQGHYVVAYAPQLRSDIYIGDPETIKRVTKESDTTAYAETWVKVYLSLWR